MIRTYTRLMRLPTFEERLRYLSIDGSVGDTTFGGHRFINQGFYHSEEWRVIRDYVIVRDSGCDLAHPDHPIAGRMVIHHMKPLTISDFDDITDYLLDPEYLVCVSHKTHNMIHYGEIDTIPRAYIPRSQNDTCPWK